MNAVVSQRVHLLLAVVAAGAAAFAFGWPTRHGEFLMGDDQRFVTEHVYVNHPSARNAWKLLTIPHGDLWQPLPMLSFQANYAMAPRAPQSRFGVSANAFHVTNIVLHALNAELACLAAMRLSRRISIAMLTGLMFACHPLALEPVAWVSGRMMLLATAFALATMLICLRRPADGRGAWPIWAGITWVLSLSSKVIPTVPITIAWCDYRRSEKPLWHRLPAGGTRAWITYAVLLALGLVATVVAAGITHDAGFSQDIEAETGTAAPVRLLLGFRYYAENYLWPTRISPWAPPPMAVAPSSVPALIAIAEVLGLAALIAITRRRSPLAFTGLILFCILMAPFLAASLSRRLIAADRYMYLPIVGLHLAVSAAIVQLAERLGRSGKKLLACGPPAIAAACLATWMTLGWRLAPCWADTVPFHERAAAVFPDNVLAHAALARAHVFTHQPEQALCVVADARRRWPDHPRLAAEAGDAYRLLERWAEAERELRRAAAAMPDNTRVKYHLALSLEKLGDSGEARAALEAIRARDPGFLPAVTALARLYTAAGDVEAATKAYESALRINPIHRTSLLGLAELRMDQALWPDAEALLRRALAMDAADQPAAFQLGVCLFHQGRFKEALTLYDGLLASGAEADAVLLNRAQVLAALQRWSEAEATYRGILRDAPGNLLAAIELHHLLLQRDDRAGLLELWVRFPQPVDPSPRLRLYLAWAHALNGEDARAEELIKAIPTSDATHQFARWIWVHRALREGSDERLRLAFQGLALTAKRDQASAAYGRLVGSALAHLPDSVRQSPAGRYTLSRFLAFSGDLENSRIAARQLAESAPPNEWTRAAAALLSDLSAPKAPGPTPTADESAED